MQKQIHRFLAVILAAAIVFGAAIPAFAQEQIATVTQITELRQEGTDGNKVTAKITVTDTEGNPVTEDADTANVTFYVGTSKTSNYLGEDGTLELSRNVSSTKDGVYDVYAVYAGKGDYAPSESAHITLTVVKPTITLSASASLAGKSTGKILIHGDYNAFAYYKSPNGTTIPVTERTIAGLSAGTYYVQVTPYTDGNTFYLASRNVSVTVEEAESITHTLTLAGEHVVWQDADAQPVAGAEVAAAEGDETVLFADADAGYSVTDVSVAPAGAAEVIFDAETGKVTVANITDDVTLTAIVADVRRDTRVEIELSQSAENGRVLLAEIHVVDADGNAVSEDANADNVRLYVNGGFVSGKLDEDGARTLKKSLVDGENEIYAQYIGQGLYRSAESARATVTAKQTTLTAADITAEPSFAGKSTGALRVATDYAYFEYYKQPNGQASRVAGDTADALAAGEYYVYIPAYQDGNTFYLESAKVSAVIDETPEFYYRVTTAGEHAVWQADAIEIAQGASDTLTLSAEPGYIISAVSAQPAENADVLYDAETGTVTVSEIRGDVTLEATFRYQSDENDAYTVTLTDDARVVWHANGGQVKVVYGATGSVYVRSADEDAYFIDTVTVTPAYGADVTYSATGEVLIQNIISDITLTADVTEKNPVKALRVDYTFETGGNYSEANPAVAVIFRVTAADAQGDPVPGVDVYYKEDLAERSFQLIRETDADGVATFKYAYALAEGADRADVTAAFALDGAFTDAVTQELHIIQQKSKDLVLYEDQIIAATPNENNGKLIRVPDAYELYDGEIHQGAIVSGGAWIRAVNGEIGGLSVGQHAIRFAEYADFANHTFYLKSDYGVFTVPRGFWTVTADTERSPHVLFTQATVYNAEPGGTVYFYLTPEDGYEITGYAVSNPNYVSGGIVYNAEDGYLAIEGVTGSITLTVTAALIPVEEPETTPEQSGGQTPANAEAAKSRGFFPALVAFLRAVIRFVKSLYANFSPAREH